MLSVRLYRLLIILVLTIVVRLPAIYPQTPSTRTSATEDKAVSASISFGEFFDASNRELKPSNKLQSVNGKRVTLTGFMAQMEVEPEGSFYLVPRPVFCDEEGGGNADLPPESVLVVAPFLKNHKIPFVPWPLEVTGVLTLGNQEKNGQVSAIRLTLDESQSAQDQMQKLERTPHH
jgi:hypothetical protein